MNDTAPISQYEQERRDKLKKLIDLGVNPYGQRTEGLTPLAAIKSQFAPEMGQDGGPLVKGAGRVVLKRDMGKLSFLTLRDESGDLQVAFDKKRLPERDWQINDLIDLGDQIIVEGKLGTTKKGETTVWATAIDFASKALLPPPAKWEGLSDVEARYRQRYVDLWSNPEVMRTLKLRMQIVDEIRRYMRDRGYLEVETPMMQTLHGGAAARPFETHHNALDLKLYMRIAPELYLKRLLVGGFTKVFELNRNFRNEGISPRHNPEFTMLEAYEAFGNWETMADLVEGMICHIAEKLFGGLKINHYDSTGREAVAAYLSQPSAGTLERVCKARLDLLSSGKGTLFVAPATGSEISALANGSEGYEAGQPHFDHMMDRIKFHLAGKGPHEQRELLLARFVTKTINLQRPWRRVRMVDLVEEETGWKFDKRDVRFSSPKVAAMLTIRHWDEFIRSLYTKPEHGTPPSGPSAPQEYVERLYTLFASTNERPADVPEDDWDFWRPFWEGLAESRPAEQLTEAYEKFVEPKLNNPTFVTHVPSVIIPLARKNCEDDFFADVYELAINGQEISPGYTELNDPDVQAANFQTQVGDKEEQQKVDEDFLTALRYGMPPAGGMGLGIDRLVMMLTGAESIRDVILFPLMRPQG